MKVCTKCNTEKSYDDFYKNKNRADLHSIFCKDCMRKSYKGYYKRNKEKLNEKGKDWRDNNKNWMADYNKQYRESNPDKIKDAQIRFKNKNPEYKKNYDNEKYKTDINFKIKKLLRNRVYEVLKNNKKEKTIDLLGCTLNFFKSHIESLFDDNMSWGNYGSWHIDHILPCGEFKLVHSEERELCFNWSNLRPLWAVDNIKKSNKIL